MARDGGGIMGRALRMRALARWQAAARDAGRTPLPRLLRQRDEARALRTALDRVEHVAQLRLRRPPAAPQPGTDWSWRPPLFSAPLALRSLDAPQSGAALLDTDGAAAVTLFHDDPAADILLAQGGSRGVHALALDVYGFAGTFLSLVLHLPPEAREGLTRRHLLRLAPVLSLERHAGLVARLNIRHGPNVAQQLRAVPVPQDARTATEAAVEFDLAYTELNARRIEEIWIDLILDAPAMNRLVLHDLTLSRHPRAPL